MKAKILALKPTQFAVGMDEVEFRVKEMTKMKPNTRHEYVHSHKIPVIRGPEGLYLIDKHHLVRALWEMGHDHVPVVIKADLRKALRFWDGMMHNNWVYCVDQFGQPRLPRDLPRNIRCMADNPWRSLAWKARIKGGFDKDLTPFSEFEWAWFFFTNLKSSDDVVGALKLCKSKKAKHLPGYKHGPKATIRSKS